MAPTSLGRHQGPGSLLIVHPPVWELVWGSSGGSLSPPLSHGLVNPSSSCAVWKFGEKLGLAMMMRVSELCCVCSKARVWGVGWHAEGLAVTGGSGAAVTLGRGLCSTPRAVGSCLGMRVCLEWGKYWSVRGWGGLSCRSQTVGGGRWRAVTCLARENPWSAERDGRVCLSAPLKDANDTKYRGLQINLGRGRWGSACALEILQ